MPPRTDWQVHRRVAQHSPSRNPTTPHPTLHPTTETHLCHPSRQASKPSQAKPHQKHTQDNPTPQNHRHLHLLCCFFPFSSSALAQLLCHPTICTCSNDAPTLKKKMLLLSPEPSFLPCLGCGKSKEQEGLLELASRFQAFLCFPLASVFSFFHEIVA